MTPLALLRSLLPRSDARFEIAVVDDLVPAESLEAADELLAPLQLCKFDSDGGVADVHQAVCRFAGTAALHDAERIAAYLRAWASALPAIYAQLVEEEPYLYAHDLVFPQLLGDASLRSEDDFARVFSDGGRILELFRGARRADSAPAALSASWDVIEEWAASHAPQLAASFGSGASEEELRALEHELALELPEDFLESWRRHDGQIEDYGLFAGGYALLPVSKIRAKCTEWREYAERFAALGDVVQADPRVANLWRHPQWIPFATNAGGDTLCLDFAPAEGGAVGQIVPVYRDQSERTVLAPSLTDLFSELNALLTAGVCTFDDDFGCVLVSG